MDHRNMKKIAVLLMVVILSNLLVIGLSAAVTPGTASNGKIVALSEDVIAPVEAPVTPVNVAPQTSDLIVAVFAVAVTAGAALVATGKRN